MTEQPVKTVTVTNCPPFAGATDGVNYDNVLGKTGVVLKSAAFHGYVFYLVSFPFCHGDLKRWVPVEYLTPQGS